MRSLRSMRDPAPSRSAYRLQRLWLTPGVRIGLRWGLPALCLGLSIGLWGADADRRAALIGSFAELRRDVEQRPEFMVKLLAIEGASVPVSTELRQSLPIDFPISSFDIDLEAIRALVEGIDAVREASVRVRAGGILEVVVAEREPAVVWRGPEGLELLDESGERVMQLDARADRADLPLIAGAGAERAVPEALALIGGARLISQRIRGLQRVGERRWDVVLDRRQRILLPETDPGAALQRVIALDEVRNLLSRDLTVVDMRIPARPTLRMSAAAAESFRETQVTENERQ